jgi:hypothetical protein
MLPPDEGLDADDGVQLEIDDGLVVDDELLGADRSSQVGDQLEPADHVLGHPRRVHDVLGLPSRLRPVHGDVGRTQEVVRDGAERDTDARTDEDLPPFYLERALGEQPRCDLRRRSQRGRRPPPR